MPALVIRIKLLSAWKKPSAVHSDGLLHIKENYGSIPAFGSALCGGLKIKLRRCFQEHGLRALRSTNARCRTHAFRLLLRTTHFKSLLNRRKDHLVNKGILSASSIKGRLSKIAKV